MRAARWVVIGTAIVAAAAAFHLLMTPDGGSWSGSRAGSGTADRGAGSAADAARGDRGSDDRSGRTWAGSGAGGGDRGSAGAEAGGGPPLDEIDAESREAMRNFLRESARDGTDAKPDDR